MSTLTSSPPFSSPTRKTTPSVSYETFAPRSTEQVARLSRIAALTAGPWAVSDSSSTTNDEPSAKASSRNAVMQAMLPPPLDPQEATEKMLQKDQLVQKAWQQANKATELWTNQVKHTTSLRLALRASVNIAEDLGHRHADLLRHSGELSAAADRLQDEERLLTQHAEEIGRPLQHYDAVDRIGVLVGVLFRGKTTVRGLAKLKVDHDEYPQILEEIDQAVAFFGHESGGKEALDEEMKRRKSHPNEMLSGNVEYYRRALALQEAALDLIKEAVAERIQNTTSQIEAALNTSRNPVTADQLEASLIFTRFHGISSRSHRLLSLVKERLSRGDVYHEILHTCRQTYCNSREILLRLTVQAHMEKLQQQHGPVGMTRLASVFLIRLCTLETSLYLDFFGDKQEELVDGTSKSNTMASQVMADDGTFYDSDFQSYLTSLCTALHRTVRRSLVTMLDLDTLCQIVSVLHEERSLASSSPTTMAAARAIAGVIQDAQERLIFCANSTLNREVIRFKPTAADLAYPEKLVAKDTPECSANTEDEDAMEKQLERVYESWFPPTRSVLRILSKIFRVVEPKVFEDVALTAVQACTLCLKDGAVAILKQKGQRHADLFLVKHLLILREQLSPFDIELRSVERQLDFSEAGKAVARFLANRNRRLFAMSTENALLTLMREGVSVQESSVDSKRDLEDALRSACNDFIEHTSQTIAGDFLSKMDELRSCTSQGEAPPSCCVKPETLEELLNSIQETLEASMKDVFTQMSLYLDNPATQNILLKPVSRKITGSTEELRKFVTQQSGSNGEFDESKCAKLFELLDKIDQHVKRK